MAVRSRAPAPAVIGYHFIRQVYTQPYLGGELCPLRLLFGWSPRSCCSLRWCPIAILPYYPGRILPLGDRINFDLPIGEFSPIVGLQVLFGAPHFWMWKNYFRSSLSLTDRCRPCLPRSEYIESDVCVWHCRYASYQAFSTINSADWCPFLVLERCDELNPFKGKCLTMMDQNRHPCFDKDQYPGSREAMRSLFLLLLWPPVDMLTYKIPYKYNTASLYALFLSL